MTAVRLQRRTPFLFSYLSSLKLSVGSQLFYQAPFSPPLPLTLPTSDCGYIDEVFTLIRDDWTVHKS